MNKLFSVIIPAYNAAKYIEDCVESVIEQDYDNYEIIIIDDGSTDNTLEICNSLAKRYNKIRVFTQENMGVSLTRAKAVKYAEGKYLIFCDSDDLFCKNSFGLLSDLLLNNDIDVLTYNITNIYENLSCVDNGRLFSCSEMKEEIYPYLLEDKYGRYFHTSLCSGIYKKELYEKCQVEACKIEIGEDLACKKSVVYNAKTLYVLDSTLYFYRTNDASVTRSKKVFLWDGPELIGKHLNKKINLDEYDFREQLYRVVTHQLFLVALSQFNSSKKYKEIKKDIIKNLDNNYYSNSIVRCKYSKKYLKGNLAKYILKYKLIFLLYILSKVY